MFILVKKLSTLKVFGAAVVTRLVEFQKNLPGQGGATQYRM